MKHEKTFADLIQQCSEALRPPERLTVAQAAEKYRYLHNPGSYVGPWKNSTVPYLVEVMDTLNSREYNSTVFVAPAQCGKTDSILNWQLYTVICDPADMILYQTSQTVARDFSRRRVDRLHRHSPDVGKRVMKRADADNTFDKHYTSGMMFTLSWPTINELSGRPVGRVALTDYDRMPPDIDGEGSPFDLARKRTTTFGSFAMTFVESSPGYSVTAPNWMPQSKHDAPPAPGILALYNRGDRRRWYWPCPHCGEYYEPTFSLLVWPSSNDIMESAEAAQMACPKCGALTDAHMKHDLNLLGRWVGDGQSVTQDGMVIGDKPRSDMATFWLKGPAATFASWKTLVMNYLKAEQEFERTGSQDALRSTVNTDQGEPYFERGFGSSRSPEDLKSRSEEFIDEPAVPEGVRFLVATIDVQANRWEVQVHGIVPPPGEGSLFDIVVIDRFQIIKSKRVDDDGEHYWVKPGTYLEDWDLVTEQVLRKSYPLADGSGRRMEIKQVGCDSGGKKGVTSLAYAYWRNLRSEGLAGRFLLLKGVGEPSAPRVNLVYPDSSGGRKDKRALSKGEIPVLMLQTDKLKDQLDNMLDRETPGGMIRFSDVLPDEFYTELTVEQKDLKGKWINPRKYRNEAWDLLVYLLALLSHMRVEYLNWEEPPSWAETWESNTMILMPEDKEGRFETKKKTVYNDLKSLAELLA
jgi:phage terminase large subunit GpA-like protein